jgi:hypothetical protein
MNDKEFRLILVGLGERRRAKVEIPRGMRHFPNVIGIRLGLMGALD